MSQSSIHIENSNASALIHNERVFKIEHAIDDKARNEYKSFVQIQDRVLEAKQDYQNNQKNHRRISSRAKLVKEAIINLNENHTLDDVEKMCQMLKKKYKYETMHIAIHRDEGYIDKETNEKHYNYHAHIMLLNYDFETHRTIRPTKAQFSRLQTDVAKSLNMTRGKVSNKVHAKELNVKVEEASKRLDSFEYKEVKEKEAYNFRAMQKRITALESLNNEQKKELHKLNTKVKNDKADVSELEAKIQELEQQLQIVRNLRKTDKAKIKELEEKEPQVIEVEKEVSKEEDIKKIAELETLLQKRKEEAEERETYLKSMHAKAIKAKNNELEALKATNDTLKQEKSSNTQYISDLEDELRDYQREEKEANLEVKEIFAEHKIFRMQSVSSIVSFLKDKYVELKEKITSLTKENDTLKAEADKRMQEDFSKMTENLKKANQNTQKEELK